MVSLSDVGPEGRLQIKLKRFNHNLILRERRRIARKRAADSDEPSRSVQYAKTLLHPFENIGGYSGVCVIYT